MRTVSLIICITLFGIQASIAQEPALDWAISVGGPNDDRAESSAVDQNGNVIIGGYFVDTLDFDPGPAEFLLVSEGQQDIFIQKLDPAGNLLWAKQIGGPGFDYITSISVDTSGHIVATGEFNGSVDFDPGPDTVRLISEGFSDIFVLKLNVDGNFVWAKRMGSTDFDGGTAITVDKAGNVITTGYFLGTVDFDPGPEMFVLTYNGGLFDMFIQKLDVDGNFVWAGAILGEMDFDDVFAHAISTDYQGNILITGEFENTADFNPGIGTFNLTSNGLYDVFVLKLDKNGNFVWAKQFGGSADDTGFALTADEAGNVFTTGRFRDETDFDPGPETFILPAQGSGDCFIQKLDNTGKFLWALSMGGAGSVVSSSITLDTSGNIFTAGAFAGEIDFDPGPDTSAIFTTGGGDIFLQKLNPVGNLLWIRGFGGPGPDGGASVNLDQTNQIYISGIFKDTVDFDPGSGMFLLPSAGGFDFFVSKWIECESTTDTITVMACDSFILNGQTLIASGIYTQTLTNVVGCDSILILNLTINQNTRDTLEMTACDSFALNGETFTETGTYIQTLMNAAGCDSLLTINLILNQSTSDTLDMTACDSFALNGETYTESGTYVQTLMNVAGCDSFLTLNLIITPGYVETLDTMTCDSFTLNGETYLLSGTYQQIFTDSAGCDSTLILNLTINESTTENLEITACDSFALNGETFTESGTFTRMLMSSKGCDSIIILALTINLTSNAVLDTTSCDSLSLNDMTYAETGTYMQTLTNVNGCDSILTLNLTILNSSTESLDIMTCDSFTLNGEVYTETGTYSQMLVNVSGCDSTLILNLDVISIDTGLVKEANTLQSNTPDAIYQWLDCDNNFSPIDGETGQVFTAGESGNFAVEIRKGDCIDTSACYAINVVGVVDPGFSRQLKVFPNPGSGTYLLEVDGNYGTISLEVLNKIGLSMSKDKLHNTGKLRFEINGPAGLYFLVVENEIGERGVLRVILE